MKISCAFILNGFLGVLFSAGLVVGSLAQEARDMKPVDMVYPLLDTDHSRWFFFSSASRPFGMVNLSPDTEVDGAWGSGYRYLTDTIRGFSHIHAWQLSGLSVMPVVIQGENTGKLFSDYYSVFTHEKEKVSPGYHSVVLERYGIKAELTSTKRVGMHRYRFPREGKAGILFNLNGILGPSDHFGGVLEKTGEKELTGLVVNSPTSRRPKPAPVYFRIQLNVPILEIHKDADTGNYLIILPGEPEEVLMKAGISYTSLPNATLNLSTELPHWDFDQVVDESQEEWNNLLSRIEVKGGTEKDQRRFYTDLWHALQGRRTISDVNGAYPDHTGETFRIGQLPLDENGMPRFNHYNSDSFWGAQWTLNTLWGLVYPEIMEEFVNSLLTYYNDGGLVPRGPSGGNYTYVMTGASSTPFVVSAFQKGIRGYDTELAYQALRKNHMPGGIMEKAGYEHHTSKGGGLQYYLDKGYVPYPLPEGKFGNHQDGAGLTLEYAYQDWTLAQMAKELGHSTDFTYFLSRSQNYQHVFDGETGWMRAKDKDGTWYQPFDPYQYQHGFVESNSAQATWFVPHDIPGLAQIMGGKEKAVEKLDQQFRQAEKLGFTSGNSHERELHPEYSRIPINYGNQPSMQTAYIFNLLDRPDLTQFWSRKVLAKAFSGLSPSTGYNGDEDQGFMGSLAVLMKMGLFQMNGGTEVNPSYQLGSPIFDQITINLNRDFYSGKQFVIQAHHNGPENYYIHRKTFNGISLNKNSLSHQEITSGGVLTLELSDKVGP